MSLMSVTSWFELPDTNKCFCVHRFNLHIHELLHQCTKGQQLISCQWSDCIQFSATLNFYAAWTITMSPKWMHELICVWLNSDVTDPSALPAAQTASASTSASASASAVGAAGGEQTQTNKHKQTVRNRNKQKLLLLNAATKTSSFWNETLQVFVIRPAVITTRARHWLQTSSGSWPSTSHLLWASQDQSSSDWVSLRPRLRVFS